MLWRVWEECHLAGALERNPELALMLCAGPRLTSWLNPRAIRKIAAQTIHLFVIDVPLLIGTE